MSPETYLQHASGYLELGMIEDAELELEKIPPESRSGISYQEISIQILLHRKNWIRALELAEQICTAHPDYDHAYIHKAFCLHELKRTSEAKRVLMNAPESLKKTGIYYYNLACYEAKMNDLEAARENLKTAFRLDPSFKEAAMSDIDLEVLKDELEKL